MADKIQKPEDIKSTLFPKLHYQNLSQLKSALRFFPNGVYVHGDGNMYPVKKMSDDRMIFHNDNADNFGAKYRKFYGKNDSVPADLQAFEKELVDATNEEKKEKASQETMKTSTNPNAMPNEAAVQGVPPPPTSEQAPVASAPDETKTKK